MHLYVMKQTILSLFLIMIAYTNGMAQTFVDAEIFRFASGVHFTTTLKVDSIGNIYLSGEMGNEHHNIGQEFGEFEFYNVNVSDGFILKLSPDLEVLWVRPVVGVGLNGELPDNRVDDLIPWGNDGVLVKPSNFSLIEGEDTLYSLGNSPLLELSATGTLVAPHFAPFGNNGGLESAGGDTVLVLWNNLIKHSVSEGTLWEFPVTSSSARWFYDMTKGVNGSAYLVGNYYESELELNGTNLPFSQNSRGFIAKVESDGTLAWLKGIDSPESNLLSVTYDPVLDRVTAGGYFTDWVLDENQEVIDASNSTDMLLSTYDSEGTLVKVLTGSGTFRGMTSDGEGKLFVIASFGNPAQLGGAGIDGGNHLIKLGADLDPIWLKDLNMSFGTRGLVHVDPTSHDIIITGKAPNYQEVHLDEIVIPPGIDESNLVVARIKDDTSTFYLSGRVFIDTNANGILDQGESGVPNQPITLGGQTVYTGQLGSYVFSVISGSHLIQSTSLNNYWTLTPSEIELNTDSIISYYSGLDFAIIAEDSTQDLRISVSTLLPPRPGFEYQYHATVKNVGTTLSEGRLIILIDPEVDTLSVWPSVTAGILDTLVWNFGNLAPFESTSLVINTAISPATPLGSSVQSYFEVQVNGADENPNDNATFFEETVVGSYDPNDKLCDLEGGNELSDIQEGMTYTIRFQNTGTFYAQDVRVVDTISQYLDFESIETLGASHDYFVQRRSPNVIEWIFPSIFLPDSLADFEGSQGFVTFKVLPRQQFGSGASIDNSASIYFDFNEPIITDVVQTFAVISGTHVSL